MKSFIRQHFISLAVVFALLLPGSMFAQLPLMDIGLSPLGSNQIEVKVRPTGNFDGNFSNLQFAISWTSNPGVSIGAPVLQFPMNAFFNPVAAGVKQSNGTKSYQTFAAFASQPISQSAVSFGAPASWVAGSEYTVLVLNVGVPSGKSLSDYNFEIANDAFAVSASNNMVFYAELNGKSTENSGFAQTGTIFTGSSSSLPVEVTNFTVTRANEHDVMVNWVTKVEVNNDYFEIEKALGNGDFKTITKVDGAGTTTATTNYAYLDQSGMANKNYFRLKQVDFDGSFTYSQVVEIDIDLVANDKFVLYPNPATDHAFLKATGQLDGDYKFTISDLTGKTVMKGVIPQNTPNREFRIGLDDFASGTYYIKTQSPMGKFYLNRLVIAE